MNVKGTRLLEVSTQKSVDSWGFVFHFFCKMGIIMALHHSEKKRDRCYSLVVATLRQERGDQPCSNNCLDI